MYRFNIKVFGSVPVENGIVKMYAGIVKEQRELSLTN